MSIAEADVQMTAVDYDPFAAPQIVRSFPTTDAQREVWLAAELGREASLAYNESVSLTFKGALDVPVLQQALQALIERHESLRATFDADGSNMLIGDQIELPLAVVDCSGEGEAAIEQKLSRLRDDAVESPFDLMNGPLVRTTLVRTAADVHVLILTTHHIICDGWSFGIVCRDLMALYDQIVRGEPTSKLSAPESFSDYAISSRSREQASIADADEDYWVNLFDQSHPVLDLPTDKPRGGQRSFASQRIDYLLPPDLVDSVRKLGAKQGVSLFATLFGVFAAMMERLGSDDGDVVVGVPAAGQSVGGLDSLVGHCVNLLPIRVNTDRKAELPAFLKQAGANVLDAYEHQSCTFGQLLTKLNVPRESNRLPLVSVLFNIDSPIPSDQLSLDGLVVSLQSNPRAYENFELFVNATQSDTGIVLECQYHSLLFDAETINRWLALYESALRRAVENPQSQLHDLFSAADQDIETLRSFNQSTQTYPRDDRIETLFDQQVSRTPNATAIVCGAESLTYRDLQEKANAVAHELIARGVGSGDLVGIACGRNLQLVPAMLGILKSGAAYVPLDPTFPEERLSYMCEDADVRCIVSDSLTEYSAGKPIDVIVADKLTGDSHDIAALSDPMAPAYVIYTSGSTGKPKGVVVHHRAVVNFLTSMAAEPGLNESDRLVAVTTTSFDISVLELYLPLIVGARVILADRDTVLEGERLRALIEREDATVLQATPAGWRLLIDSGWSGDRAFKALVGGEALSEDLAQELCARAGEVWNMYGPTETTVWSSCWKVSENSEAIRIGAPIANTEIQILDDNMAPCPIGVPGQVFIGGDGVATGYWKRSELTDERFVTWNGKRIYKTGDRGRWRNDGTLEHLGRLDFQVKVRGYRIELGEIEKALLDIDEIERAVVLAREDEPGDVRLVAYLVSSSGKSVEEDRIREVLRKSLPEYMIPAHIVSLEAIPLLPNGKVNRKSLPRPQIEQLTPVGDAIPQNKTEAAVLRAMEEILNLRGLGMGKDFFAAGGHSLLAARLTARLNKELDVVIPLRTVFIHSTPRALAQVIDTSKASPDVGKAKPTFATQTNQDTGPLTAMQERIRFMEELHPGRVVYNTPSAHRLKGPFDKTAFAAALNKMVQRQSSLRTKIEMGPEGSYQRVVELNEVELPFEDLTSIVEADRDSVLMERMQTIIDQPFDIGVAPLFKTALYRLAPDEHVFLFMPHHIVWDGWSFDLLYDEMSAHYSAELKNESVDLPELQASYLDYAYWHSDWMDGEECDRQVSYWRNRFDTMDTPLALPTDRPRSVGMTGEGRVKWMHVEKELTEKLRQLAMSHGATLNMLVMAIYAAQMTQATSGKSLVIGVPVRGRLVTEVEPLMGFFNNLLPITLTINKELPISDWLAVVKRDLIDAFAHQDVPFERLATEKEVARHTSRAGLYQTLFSFQDARERKRTWGSLDHSSVLVMQKGATEDFGLWLMEVPNGLEGGINYNADLFDEETAQIFRDRVLGLMKRVVENPTQSLETLLADPGSDAEAFTSWITKRNAPVVEPSDVATTTNEPRETDLTESGQKLAAIWSKLLGIDEEDIEADDNFFDLGGNSMLVMRAVADARAQCNLIIDPRRYVYETLEQLSSSGAAQLSNMENPEGYVPIAHIWANLLGIDADDIDPEDNFFDLGGTSLLAMRAVTAMGKELGLKIDPRRMVYESIQQLSIPSTDDFGPTQTAADEPEQKGMLSRVLRRMVRKA